MYSHEPSDYSCPFCSYANGVFNDRVGASHVVERTPETLAFVSPRWWVNNEGHVIVIPLAHVENLYVIPDALAVPLMAALRRTALALKGAYSCAGTSVRQHNEPAGNQELWHLHFHVFPRYEGDEFYGSAFRPAGPGEMDDRAARLRAAYSAF